MRMELTIKGRLLAVVELDQEKRMLFYGKMVS